eukprot:COSAG06_NODE_16090_length_1023_cov_1.001082_2_plen_105_part_00
MGGSAIAAWGWTDEISDGVCVFCPVQFSPEPVLSNDGRFYYQLAPIMDLFQVSLAPRMDLIWFCPVQSRACLVKFSWSVHRHRKLTKQTHVCPFLARIRGDPRG